MVEPASLHFRVVLIGDAGLYLENDPTLEALGSWTSGSPHSAVLFLGDNIYDDGLIEEERVEAERILGQRLAACASITGDVQLLAHREDALSRQKASRAACVAEKRAESVEQAKKQIADFVATEGVNYPCVIGDEATQQAVGVEGYPTTLFIDHTGKVRLKVVGYHPYEKLEGYVAELVAERQADKPSS